MEYQVYIYKNIYERKVYKTREKVPSINNDRIQGWKVVMA
jgi:hypothetical protein